MRHPPEVFTLFRWATFYKCKKWSIFRGRFRVIIRGRFRVIIRAQCSKEGDQNVFVYA